jgi:hypothetical protein
MRSACNFLSALAGPQQHNHKTTLMLVAARHDLSNSTETKHAHACVHAWQIDATARPTLWRLGNRNASRAVKREHRAVTADECYSLRRRCGCTPCVGRSRPGRTLERRLYISRTASPPHQELNQNGAGSRVPTLVVARGSMPFFHGRHLIDRHTTSPSGRFASSASTDQSVFRSYPMIAPRPWRDDWSADEHGRQATEELGLRMYISFTVVGTKSVSWKLTQRRPLLLILSFCW